MSALIEQASAHSGGIMPASTLESTDTEQLLMDGAIDQTFAFSRSAFIALTAAKIEMSDKLPQVQPEHYLLEQIRSVARTLQVGVQELLLTPRHAEML